MEVNLLQCTDVDILVNAIRRCWRSENKSDTLATEKEVILGENDRKLIKRIDSLGHHSTFEHVVFTFDIRGVSRALLQELVRHRIASYSVESTRFCLKRITAYKDNLDSLLVLTGNDLVDNLGRMSLEKIVGLIEGGHQIPNDKLKYALPESFKTNVVMTINLRSFLNLYHLRISPQALWEFRLLTQAMVDVLPKDFQSLFFSQDT